MIRIEHVSFSYEGSQEECLSDCNLSIAQGQFVLLCGKSGCGKTTLTKLVNGLIPSQTGGHLTGTVYLNNKNVLEQPIWELSQSVGSVFQNPKTQFFNLDTTSELVFGLENAGAPRETIKTRLHDVVKEYHLEKLAGQGVFALSGGEKQKIAIASAYMSAPSVYVLDEPSANLDQSEIFRLRALLKKLKQDGKTILIAEHRVWYLTELLDRAVLIEDGKIATQWTREQFLSLDANKSAEYGLRSLCPTKISHNTPDHTDARGLTVNKAKISRNRRVLWENLSFSAPRGKAIAISGKNGAGKTTLAHCLCGLRKMQSGEIWLDGKRMTRKQLRKNSFLIMQDVNHQLFGDSVMAEAQMGNEASAAQIKEALAAMQLDSFLESHPMALSGGQKQRLAIAVGCLCKKDILIFDEPTSGLDLDNMKRVGTLIQALLERNKIVVIITHDMEFINYIDAVSI